MTTGTLIAKGVVHGRTISLDQEPGLPDGLQVMVTMQPMASTDDTELMALTEPDAAWLRRDLEHAWSNRQGAVSGERFFAQLAEQSASLKAQGK